MFELFNLETIEDLFSLGGNVFIFTPIFLSYKKEKKGK